MELKAKMKITVQTKIEAPIQVVWKNWTTPEDIINWNNASDDWHTPWAKNDLRPGGSFTYRMEAKDGSVGFDFSGVYSNVVFTEKIESMLGDGRELKVFFNTLDNGTEVIETFEAENTNSEEMQRAGWQAILDNFKKYTEGNNK